jgi:hypothetical protein
MSDGERGRESTVADSTLDLHERRGVIYLVDEQLCSIRVFWYVPRCIGVSPRNNATYALSTISPLSGLA